MIALLLALCAGAADLEWALQPSERTFKIEVYLHGLLPGVLYTYDWHELDFEYFSLLLRCEGTEPGLERCHPVGNELEWGFRLDGQSEIQSHLLPLAADLHLKRRRNGSLTGDFEGNLEPLHLAYANALGGRHEHPDQWKPGPDLSRKIGEEFEDVLLFMILGALHFELPRRPSDPEWIASGPQAGRTWRQGVYGGRVHSMVVGQALDQRMLEGTGDIGELHSAASLLDWRTEGVVKMNAMFDLATGGLTSNRIEVAFERSVSGYFARRRVLMRLARDGDTVHAGEIEGAMIER